MHVLESERQLFYITFISRRPIFHPDQPHWLVESHDDTHEQSRHLSTSHWQLSSPKFLNIPIRYCYFTFTLFE